MEGLGPKTDKNRMSRSLSDVFRDKMDTNTLFKSQEEPSALKHIIKPTGNLKTSRDNLKVAFNVPEPKVSRS